eukprot:TRINITY_DN4607_c0_g1_i11.p3 TRINITY_DN4607_c0_g1~~TRINITY_DN4607_c0_g1_i11.p3  ORF type:complete len:131 (-),score=24.54 TRINITY_DN4607_c0_g1_i11:6-398(-)
MGILEGPAEEPYLPQKKGVDVSTQIWDYDLFDYDREVEPILSVLVGKTLEQARLEVDEDAEIEAIRKYKSEYAERRQIAVSYTHLTLPTILLVQISVVAVSLKKKKKTTIHTDTTAKQKKIQCTQHYVQV